MTEASIKQPDQFVNTAPNAAVLYNLRTGIHYLSHAYAELYLSDFMLQPDYAALFTTTIYDLRKIYEFLDERMQLAALRASKNEASS